METSYCSGSTCRRPDWKWPAAGMAYAAMLILAACSTRTEPETAQIEMTSRADTVAMQVLQATGGPEAWAGVRYIRFDFAVEREGAQRPAVRHLWDRHEGRYRVEWTRGTDTTVVALFNVNTRDGYAFVNGKEAGVDEAALLETAYQRFINDMYWLMAPTKLFDPGVTRTYLPDSSSSDTEMIHLAFADVGLTPGDQYWIEVDRNSGDVVKWTYVLQGPGARTSSYYWTDYRNFEMPSGTVRLAQRKESVTAPVAILTEVHALPPSVPDELFANPQVAME